MDSHLPNLLSDLPFNLPTLAALVAFIDAGEHRDVEHASLATGSQLLHLLEASLSPTACPADTAAVLHCFSTVASCPEWGQCLVRVPGENYEAQGLPGQQ